VTTRSSTVVTMLQSPPRRGYSEIRGSSISAAVTPALADQAFIANITYDTELVQSERSAARQKKRKVDSEISPTHQPLSTGRGDLPRSPNRPRLLKTAPERRLFTPSLQQIELWAWASMSTVPTLAPPPNRFSSTDGGSSTFSQRGITPSADKPKGDQEPQHLYKVADFAYYELEHYLYGISSNYTGSRLGRGEYPKLEVSVAKRRLMYEDDSILSFYMAFCNEV